MPQIQEFALQRPDMNWTQRINRKKQYVSRHLCSTFDEATKLLDNWPVTASPAPEFYLAHIDQFQIVPGRSGDIHVIIMWHIASLTE